MRTQERYERDRKMIENPTEWPGMRLPLKNPQRYNTERPAFGWLFTGMAWPEGDLERTVQLGTIFDAAAAGEEKYQDVWALLDAGWTVD